MCTTSDPVAEEAASWQIASWHDEDFCNGLRPSPTFGRSERLGHCVCYPGKVRQVFSSDGSILMNTLLNKDRKALLIGCLVVLRRDSVFAGQIRQELKWSGEF